MDTLPSHLLLSVEDIIPHRGRMKLADTIVRADEDGAVILSKVTPEWPMCDGSSVSALLAIELVAQAAGVLVGWKDKLEKGPDESGKGWLVGVKNAVFHQARIPVYAELTVSANKNLAFEYYTEIQGLVMLNQICVAEVVLQVLRAEAETE